MRRARLGLIVGKRVDKRAVARNRIKRELREAFRLQKAQLPALDIVVQVVSRPERGQAGTCLELLLERVRDLA